MIISRHSFGLQLVRQDLHMSHAGAIAASWGNGDFARTDLHESFAKGVGLHDNGWDEFDDSLPFADGGPVNFLDVDLRRHAEFYERGYRRARRNDEYAGALVGMHWMGLYLNRYGYDPAFTYHVPPQLAQFIRALISRVESEVHEGLRGCWETTRPRSAFENEVWFHYELMQLIDRLSLFLCLQAPGETAETKLGPIRRSPEEHKYIDVTARLDADGRVGLDPFPFGADLDIEVAAWRLPKSTFSEVGEYREHMSDASPCSITNRLVPAS